MVMCIFRVTIWHWNKFASLTRYRVKGLWAFKDLTLHLRSVLNYSSWLCLVSLSWRQLTSVSLIGKNKWKFTAIHIICVRYLLCYKTIHKKTHSLHTVLKCWELWHKKLWVLVWTKKMISSSTINVWIVGNYSQPSCCAFSAHINHRQQI